MSFKVKDHFYMNDLRTGVKDIDSDILLYRNMKERFLDVNFNLRKLRTNDNKLRNIIDNSVSKLVNHNEKVLGILWKDLQDV